MCGAAASTTLRVMMLTVAVAAACLLPCLSGCCCRVSLPLCCAAAVCRAALSCTGKLPSALSPSTAVVCSNINVDAEASIPHGRIQLYQLLSVGGRTVGVVGCTDADLSSQSSPGPNVFVNQNYTCINYLQKAIATMKQQTPSGVDVIVALAGMAFDNLDLIDSIATTVEGVDVVVCEYNPLQLTQAITVVTSIFGNAVVIASIPYIADPLYILGGSMLNFQLHFDASGQLVLTDSIQANCTLLNSSSPDDPRFWSNTPPLGLVETALAKIPLLDEAVVGTLLTNLTGANQGLPENASFSCLNTGCNVGLFVAEAMLNWCTDCDVACVDGGGLRSDLTVAEAHPPAPDHALQHPDAAALRQHAGVVQHARQGLPGSDPHAQPGAARRHGLPAVRQRARGLQPDDRQRRLPGAVRSGHQRLAALRPAAGDQSRHHPLSAQSVASRARARTARPVSTQSRDAQCRCVSCCSAVLLCVCCVCALVHCPVCRSQHVQHAVVRRERESVRRQRRC